MRITNELMLAELKAVSEFCGVRVSKVEPYVTQHWISGTCYIGNRLIDLPKIMHYEGKTGLRYWFLTLLMKFMPRIEQ